MRGYITLRRPRIFGTTLHIHWAALIAAGIMFGVMIRQPLDAALVVLSYFGVILLHEAGHALIAKKLGCRPSNIYLGIIHGLCEYQLPDSLKEDAMIAWGGVLAQAAVFVPLIVLSQTTALATVPFFGIPIALFGYMSLLVALLNLLPGRGLDGHLAWRLIPILLRESRQRANAKRAARDFLRRFK